MYSETLLTPSPRTSSFLFPFTYILNQTPPLAFPHIWGFYQSIRITIGVKYGASSIWGLHWRARTIDQGFYLRRRRFHSLSGGPFSLITLYEWLLAPQGLMTIKRSNYFTWPFPLGIECTSIDYKLSYTLCKRIYSSFLIGDHCKRPPTSWVWLTIGIWDWPEGFFHVVFLVRPWDYLWTLGSVSVRLSSNPWFLLSKV